ncbi:DUF6152 family protein [Arthrobacter sp. ZGTC131]|uniref:DUF6152 family protein n=1 Tax=Arthrobacter sp. ZGTC131 TaxID=2058898 RepID=UPI0015E37548|nr:DUF6152 family protein [Arthrobacter sp. ZGTC131]
MRTVGTDRLDLPPITGAAAETRARGRRVRLAASLFASIMLVVFPVSAAQAHHGFADFDTDRLYYISGTVSEVRWGEPHSYFNVTLDSGLPADTPELAVPEQLQAPEDSGPLNVAPSYSGSHEELEVVIAPPSYTGRWGLDRPLADGERVEAVGYIGRSHNNEFRPVVFWFEDGRPVNQVLGSQLPATPLPVPYPETGAPATGLPAAGTPAADSGQDASPANEASEGMWPTAVVVIVGAVLVVVSGGALYLRARSRRA